MNDIEDRITAVLNRQADSMHVPAVRLGEQTVRFTEPNRARRWPIVFAGLATAGVLALGVAANRNADTSDGVRDGGDFVTAAEPTTAPLPVPDATRVRASMPETSLSGNGSPMPDVVPPITSADTLVVDRLPARFVFETPTVRLEAQSIVVMTAGKEFVMASPSIDVAGDPGSPNYTTLELTWFEHDVEMRLFLYFASDEQEWWIDRIGVYDGSPNGEWQLSELESGIMRTPLGGPWTEDLELDNLVIRGLKLQAFTQPDACRQSDREFAVVADYPTIDSEAGGSFGATFQVFDTETCSPLPVADFDFVFTSSSEAVALIEPIEVIPDYPPTKQRIGLTLGESGSATIHVEIRAKGSDELIDAVDVPVKVG